MKPFCLNVLVCHHLPLPQHCSKYVCCTFCGWLVDHHKTRNLDSVLGVVSDETRERQRCSSCVCVCVCVCLYVCVCLCSVHTKLDKTPSTIKKHWKQLNNSHNIDSNNHNIANNNHNIANNNHSIDNNNHNIANNSWSFVWVSLWALFGGFVWGDMWGIVWGFLSSFDWGSMWSFVGGSFWGYL